MRYPMFKDVIEEAGFRVVVKEDNTFVYHHDYPIARVSNKLKYVIDLTYVTFDDLPIGTQEFISGNCMELALTDLKDRGETQEKYYLKQKGIEEGICYLNKAIGENYYIVSSKWEDNGYQTQFTQKEFDELPDYYTHPAVWEIIKIEDDK